MFKNIIKQFKSLFSADGPTQKDAKSQLSINVELVERLFGRAIDWNKTGWTEEERGIKTSKITKRNQDIDNLRAAIKRTDATIERARDEFLDDGGCPCCFWAAMGGYSGKLWRLSEKNERRQKWLAILESRKKGSATCK